MSDLLFGLVFIVDFLDDNDTKIIETVTSFTKMFVDRDRVLSFDVVSVLVDSSIRLLGFQLTNILFAIEATVAPGEVNCIFGPTICFLANFELLSASSVCKDIGVHNM